MNEFVIQLDEDMEGMQATICALQQQLKDAKTLNQRLEQENKQLRKVPEYSLAQKTPLIDGHNSIEENSFTSNISKVHEKLEPYHSTKQFIKLEEDSIERTNHDDKIGAPMCIDKSTELKVHSETLTNGCTDQYKDSDISLQIDHSADDVTHYININNESSPRLHKGATKTSFSINDLLASNTGKEFCETSSEVTMETALGLKREERNGVLGEIDDSAV